MGSRYVLRIVKLVSSSVKYWRVSKSNQVRLLPSIKIIEESESCMWVYLFISSCFFCTSALNNSFTYYFSILDTHFNFKQAYDMATKTQSFCRFYMLFLLYQLNYHNILFCFNKSNIFCIQYKSGCRQP